MSRRLENVDRGRPRSPSIWMWRHCLVPGEQVRVSRPSAKGRSLSRKVYTVVKHAKYPAGGVPVWLRQEPWIILNNGERDLAPVLLATVVPVGRTNAQR